MTSAPARCLASLLCIVHAGEVAGATPWGAISPLLERSDEWGSSYLPTVPPVSDGTAVYGEVATTHSEGFPFASYIINLDEFGSAPTGDSIIVGTRSAACNHTEPTAVKAGPSFTCPAGGYCSGPGWAEGVEACRVSTEVSGHPQFMQLGGRMGTHWAPVLGVPAWAQFIFPATPVALHVCDVT